MHEGNHMGIMTTLKKPTLERGPLLLRVPWPFFQHARVPPLLHVAHHALVPKPLRDALYPPGVVHRGKAPTDVRIKHPVDMALLTAHRHRIERIMGAAPRATSRRASATLPLIDSVQHLHRGPLDDFIFQCWEADGPLAAIRLRAVHPLDRAGMVRPAFEAV